ncbi:MAG: DUF1778 domain-containing protein [Betaproteobacteria bacterium]|jgi:uncharacterized protein (DUF1778 family)|nr:DUF1778 domain-containing protein [Rhodocyclales bacterium]
MDATVKEECIEIRLASAEKERIRQAAILSHQNVSEYVLPEEQMNAFYATLDQPAKSIPRLRELLKNTSVFEIK